MLKLLWPVGYTVIGVAVGVYVNGLIEIEREREKTILQPLFAEVRQIHQRDATSPLHPLINENGEHETVLASIPPVEILSSEPYLQSLIDQYLDAIARLESLHQPNVPIAEIFVDTGYDEIYTNALDDTVLLNSPNAGVDPTSRPPFPGPALRVGTWNGNLTDSALHFQSPAVPVQTDRRLPLFAFLLENCEAIQQATGPDDLREIAAQHGEIDVEAMDRLCATWDTQLWQVISKSWAYEADENSDPLELVRGSNFVEITQNSLQVVSMRRVECRGEIISLAEELVKYLIRRLEKRRFGIQRLRYARATGVQEPAGQRNVSVGTDR